MMSKSGLPLSVDFVQDDKSRRREIGSTIFIELRALRRLI
jgi:hypothetical protein